MLKLLKNQLVIARKNALLTCRRLTNPRVVRHCGVRLAIDENLTPAIVEWIYGGQYEKSELKGIRHSLEPDDVVLEVGAGLGFISLYCARRIGADRVHAFEANPALEGPIRRNYELNGLFPHLEICILGDRVGEEDFYVERDFWFSSKIRRTPEARAVRVPVRPFDDVLRAIDPSFLILDIEGGEYDLLRSLSGFHNVRKVAIELHEEVIGPEKIAFIGRLLAESGFTPDPRFTRDRQLFARRDVPGRT